MEERILLVEDEEKLARMVELELNYEGYQVEKACDGRAGLDLALSGRFAACGGRARYPLSCSPPGTRWWTRCPAWTWGRTTM